MFAINRKICNLASQEGITCNIRRKL